MLHVASDAPMTRHLLMALDQEAAAASGGLPGVGGGGAAARAPPSPPSPPSPPVLADSVAEGELGGSSGKPSADSAEKLGLPAPSPFEGPLAAGVVQLGAGGGAPHHRRSTTEGTDGTLGTEWGEPQKGAPPPPPRRGCACWPAAAAWLAGCSGWGGWGVGASIGKCACRCQPPRPPLLTRLLRSTPALSVPVPPCSKARYGRQLAVLFWRTFTDIGGLGLGWCVPNHAAVRPDA